MDLHGSLTYRVHEPESERVCPHCDVGLSTIDVKIEGKFLIERCGQCHGLFFDPGELEMMLDRSVSNVFHVDDSKLYKLKMDSYRCQKDFKYVKCPVCRVVMCRKSFGYQSGVIADYCSQHGIWLDSSELRQLLEWKKAGGEMRQRERGKDFGTEDIRFNLVEKDETKRSKAEPSNIKYYSQTQLDNQTGRGNDLLGFLGDLLF